MEQSREGLSRQNLRASQHDEQDDEDDSAENHPATPVVPSARASVRGGVSITVVVVSLEDVHCGAAR